MSFSNISFFPVKFSEYRRDSVWKRNVSATMKPIEWSATASVDTCQWKWNNNIQLAIQCVCCKEIRSNIYGKTRIEYAHCIICSTYFSTITIHYKCHISITYGMRIFRWLRAYFPTFFFYQNAPRPTNKAHKKAAFFFLHPWYPFNRLGVYGKQCGHR